ncbi:MAG: PKD domain-containing protein [Candidatus Aenigmarchaeota archaeon]|nr:PKD domain-containing protein [Candidatus Aenigmarchaeota archaeon]
MFKKILFSIFVMFLLVGNVFAFAADTGETTDGTYSLTINVFTSGGSSLNGNIRVYNPSNTLVCTADNVQQKICQLTSGLVYSYTVSNPAYNTGTGSVMLSGNTVRNVYLIADTTAPTMMTLTSSTHPNQNIYYNNNDPSFQWTSSDNVGIDGYSFTIDQSAGTVPDTSKDVEETTTSTSYTNLADGIWYFHIRPVDNAGNWGSALHYTVRIDTAGPVFSGCTVNPASGSPYSPGQTYTFSCTVTDISGVSSVTFNFGGSSKTVTKSGDVYTATFSNLNANTYSYTWAARDSNNIQSTNTGSYVVSQALTQMHIAINDVESDASFMVPEDFSIKTWPDVSDGTYYVYRNGVILDSGTSTVPVVHWESIVVPGTITYRMTYSGTNYYANDVIRTVTILPDNVLPTIVHTENPTSPTTYAPGQTYTFTATITDNVGVQSAQFYFDGVNYVYTQTGNTYTVMLNDLSANTHTYEWRATDINGNAATTGVINYIINRAAPVAHLSLNGVESDQTITYGVLSTALGWITTGETDGILQRDGVTVTNPETETLAAGIYTYDYIYPQTENYTTLTITRTLTVDKATPVLSLGANPGWTVAYPNTITITGSETNQGDSDLTYELVRDGIVVSNPDTVSNAGTYNYEFRTAGGENYTAGTTGVQVATITKQTPILTLTFNPVSPITYGTQMTAICTVDNLEQTPVLYRDGVDVSAENSVPVTLNAGTYSYSCEVLESANYAPSTVGPEPYTVNQANVVDPSNPLIHLALNGIESDLTIALGLQSNATGWKDIADGTLTLLRDGAPVGLEDVQTLPVGVYNYTLVFTGNVNYADASVTRFVYVSDSTAPIITITAPLTGQYTSNETWLNATTDESATCYFGTSSNPTNPMTSVGTDHSTYLTGLPYGSNTYYVRCADVYGNEAETSVTWNVVPHYDIEITSGWNLISLPLIPVSPILTSDPMWGTNYIIQHYNASLGIVQEYDSSNPGAATLSELVPDYGYWVHANTDRTFTYLGTEPGIRTVPLVNGTNMVGWTSNESVNMQIALYFISANVTSVECQDTTDTSIQALRVCNISTESFEPGKGYVINVSSASEWSYVLNVPPTANAGSDQSITVRGGITADGLGSYDLDGTIVSYVWTLGGETKTGATTTWEFNTVGTYTITLTVTDNEGATDTDDLIVTVTAPSGGGGGGGGGVSTTLPSTSGFIIINLTAPETVTATKGQSVTFTATVSNIGQTDVYNIYLEGVPPWVTMTPVNIEHLGKGESGNFIITLSVPQTAPSRQILTLTAKGSNPNATAEASATIEIIGNAAECENCAQPTAWTTCDVNGTQTRTVYTCDAETGYNCVETTETRACGGLTGYFLLLSDNPVLSAIIGIIIILIAVFGYYYSRNREKVRGKISAMLAKFKPAKKESKPQGIDFNVEYKK